MKMKRAMILIVLILVNISLFQLISASTEITLKTISYHKVDIRTLNPADSAVIETFYKTSDKDGNVVVTSTASTSFKVAVWIYEEKRSPETIVKYKLSDESFTPGTPINLEVYPDDYVVPVPEPVANLTSNDTTDANPENQNTAITGAVPGFLSGNNLIYFGGGLLVVLIIVGIVVFFLMKKKKQKYHSYGFKKQEWNSHNKEKNNTFYKTQSQKEEFDEDYSSESELEAAERKIREAQDTLKRLKNQDRIKELKSKLHQDKDRLIQDEHELIKLRGGNVPRDNNSNQGSQNKKKYNDFRR